MRKRKSQDTSPTVEFEQAEVHASPPRLRGLFWTVFSISFLSYLRTLAPGLTFGDGPELASAAYVLGVPHPTGYPLYMLLLHIWMLLPLGEPIVCGHLLSAVCAAAASGLAAVVSFDFFSALFPTWRRKSLLIGAACAGLLTAWLKLFWENAVVTEVYALHILLVFAFLRAVQSFETTYSPRHFLLAVFFLALGLAHHRLCVAQILPVGILAFLGWRRWGTAMSLRIALIALGIVILGLAFYIYIPLRAAANPPINWGDCTTWENIRRHIVGSDYLSQRFLRVAPGAPIDLSLWLRHEKLILWQLVGDIAVQAFPGRLVEYLVLSTRQYFRPTTPTFVVGLVIICLSALGFWKLLRRRWLTTTVAGLIALQNFFIILLYNIPDINDYTLFFYWLLYTCAFLALVWGVLRAFRVSGSFPLISGDVKDAEKTALRHGGFSGAYSYLLCLAPLLLFVNNFSISDQSDNHEGERLSYFVLPTKTEDMPEGALLLTYGDYDTFFSWYRQIVRRERTDVVVFGANFISSPWYASMFPKETLERLQIKFHSRVPRSPEEFAEALRVGILEQNVGRLRIFTTMPDPYVMDILSRHYEFKKGGSLFYRPRDVLGLQVLHLWEILPKPKSESKS